MSSTTSEPGSGYAAAPYDYADARRLSEDLGLAEPVAITLVRRGHRTTAEAKAFLEAEVSHDPALFAGIGDAVAAIRSAIARCERITVHGDYDVDGMCSTAILVGALRRAGAECDWLIPDRLTDGYGLSAGSVEALAERGTGLLITADCGIGSAAEIETVLEAGIEAVVTDHHHAGENLPRCPIVHPVVSGYPFDGLCGAAVAHKLVLAFEREIGVLDDAAAARDLDLVALATVADLVPLVDENRTLARRGLAELRRARRPGIRALLEVAGVEPERLDEGDIAFRLAPRLNAAGRLYRADAGVELLLTEDVARADAIALELDAANHERRETERGVSNEAEAALRGLSEEERAAPAIVVSGEGWHPGVVGIVASRLVERHGRPAIVLSVDDTGRAKGSGRSVPGFDLLGALDACAGHLHRYGGHKAAAGLELPAERIDAFRADFAEHARGAIAAGGGTPPVRIDAVVGPDALDLRVAEQFGTLGPFGQGNPDIKLLVPAARVDDVRPMGEEGKHARFSLRSGAGTLSARGVAFNANGALSAAQRVPHDLTVRLEVNHWNGGIEPRAVLAGAHERPADGSEGEDAHACSDGTVPAWWWERFEAELARGIAAPPEAAPAVAGAAGREVVSARRSSAVARIAELLSSGARVMAIAADAGRRGGLARSIDPAAFGGEGALVCLRCGPEELRSRTEAPGIRFALTDWSSLAGCPGAAERFEHLVLIDPAPSAGLEAVAAGSTGAGFVHEAWGPAEDLAELCWGAEWELRAPLAEIYRSLAGGELTGEELGHALRGPGRFPRSPEAAARCVLILTEIGVAGSGGSAAARWMGVVSSERTELERSGAWRACSSIHQEGLRYLQSRRAERRPS